MSGLNYSWYDRHTIEAGTRRGIDGLIVEQQIANRLQAEGNALVRLLLIKLGPEVQLPVQINPSTGEPMQPPAPGR